jgi:ribA/ribD-fused uncharacterized protein
MSDNPMFDEVGIDGKTGTWIKGDWKKIAVHSDDEISGFFGPYRFLSNFYLAPVWYEGLEYPSTENAYQAAKIVVEERVALTNVSPSESKKVWKGLTRYDKSAEEWDARKLEVMTELVFQKFLRHGDLRKDLLNTGDRYLEETNWWKDVHWGYDINLQNGKNYLGLTLMATRSYMKSLEKIKKNQKSC